LFFDDSFVQAFMFALPLESFVAGPSPASVRHSSAIAWSSELSPA
jgi:hypothetical protein